MSTVAFLYPGQGSQKVGMGAELLESEPELLDHYFAQAEAAAGQPVRRFALEGPIESLTRTDVVQPALFAVSLALTDAARARGVQPALAAGHSLGEYTAAVAVGAVSVEDGIELVALRDRLMALAEEAGAARVVRLQVGAAFHSELMEPVQAKMAEAMEGVAWSDPSVPLAANAFGRLVRTA